MPARDRGFHWTRPPSPQSVLSATLNNELDELADSVNLPAGQRFILALDDYHLINNQDIHQT